jgi:hypothetical protein
MLAPNDDFTHAAQGWRLVKQGDRKNARAHFLESLRINPENRWAKYGLANVPAIPKGAAILLALLFAPIAFVSKIGPQRRGLGDLVLAIATPVVIITLATGLLVLRDSLHGRRADDTESQLK